MGAALVFYNFSPIPSKISLDMNFHLTFVVTARYLHIIKFLLTREQSQHRKCSSIFSSSEQVASRSDCRRLGNALCLYLPDRPAKQSRRAARRALPSTLPSKPSIVFWNNLRE